MFKWKIAKVTKTVVGDANKLWEIHLQRVGSGNVFTVYLGGDDIEILKQHFLAEKEESLVDKEFSNNCPVPEEAVRQCIRDIYPQEYWELYKLAARSLVKGVNPNIEFSRYKVFFIRNAFNSAWVKNDLGYWVMDPTWIDFFRSDVSKCSEEDGVDIKLVDFELVDTLPHHTDPNTKWLKLVSKEKEITVIIRYGSSYPFQIIKR